MRYEPIRYEQANSELISWVFYDTKNTAQNQEVEYFQNTEGGSGSLVTNMVSAGVLPTGWKFYVTGISIAFLANETLASIQAIVNDAILKLQINQKLYFQTPVKNLPAGGGVVTAVTTAGNNGYQTPSAIYRIARLQVEDRTPFKATIKTAFATPVSLQIALHGTVLRPKN